MTAKGSPLLVDFGMNAVTNGIQHCLLAVCIAKIHGTCITNGKAYILTTMKYIEAHLKQVLRSNVPV